MSYEYDCYIDEHRTNVLMAFDWLCDKFPDLDLLPMRYQIASHDESKYEKDEYDAYDAYFYGKNKSFSVVQKFNKAWLTHIHRNPHHWQHWVLINDEPGEGKIILDMPFNYVVEMICDWWAFSWKKGDHTEIFEWYDEHKDHMQLSRSTRVIVEKLLYDIRNAIINASAWELHKKIDIAGRNLVIGFTDGIKEGE